MIVMTVMHLVSQVWLVIDAANPRCCSVTFVPPLKPKLSQSGCCVQSRLSLRKPSVTKTIQ